MLVLSALIWPIFNQLEYVFMLVIFCIGLTPDCREVLGLGRLFEGF